MALSRGYLAAAALGSYAYFGGGSTSGRDYYNYVDAFDSSLTRSNPDGFTYSCSRLAASGLSGYAIFAGGLSGTGNTYRAETNAYNSVQTRYVPANLSAARTNLSAANVGDYILFGGGKNANALNNVDAYNRSLTKTTPTALSAARFDMAASSIGDFRNMSMYTKAAGSTTLSKYALFSGGRNSTSSNATFYNTVDAYDTSLTRRIDLTLSVARHSLAATDIGNYALFAGGQSVSTTSSPSDIVDVYEYEE